MEARVLPMAYPSGRGSGPYGGNTRRYTVPDAADILGITKGAVRNCLSRGTLQSVKENDTAYFLLAEQHTERDTDDMPGESQCTHISAEGGDCLPARRE